MKAAGGQGKTGITHAQPKMVPSAQEESNDSVPVPGGMCQRPAG